MVRPPLAEAPAAPAEVCGPQAATGSDERLGRVSKRENSRRDKSKTREN